MCHQISITFELIYFVCIVAVVVVVKTLIVLVRHPIECVPSISSSKPDGTQKVYFLASAPTFYLRLLILRVILWTGFRFWCIRFECSCFFI